MTEYKIYTLIIDEEFKRLIQLCSSDKHEQLEENILRDGCNEPLCVWNETILDGHHRYEICKRHKIPFKIVYIFLHRREEAIAWICANELTRHNVTEEAKWYLIGKKYETEQVLSACIMTKNNQYMKKHWEIRLCRCYFMEWDTLRNISNARVFFMRVLKRTRGGGKL